MTGSQDFKHDARNDDALISLNGELVRREDAKVSIFDAGFVVGDGVWEGLRLHRGTLLFLDEHMDRLYWGARRIGLDIGLDRVGLEREIRRLLAANGMDDGVHLRVMITRGEKRGANQDPRNAIGRPTIVILAEWKLPDPGIVTTGISLHTASIRCTPADMFDMRLNSHSRLNLITALLEAIDAGADEALMLDPHGFVSSCNATNFFFARDGKLMSSRGDYCFNGVTRGHVIRLCQEHGVPLHLGDFPVDAARDADEAFVTGTFGGITPVKVIDGRALPASLPGPMTERVRALYEGLKDAEAHANAR
jgi:branched-chain amino acid aminotransferase